MMFATPGGRKELKIQDAVADSGAQITIFPASLLEASGIQISGMYMSKVDPRAANNAKIDVQGVRRRDQLAIAIWRAIQDNQQG